MNIKELRNIGRNKLVENNVEDVYVKIDILLQHLLKMTKTELIINQENELSKKDENKFFKCIDEVISGKPIQYITKNQEFMNLKFYVDENVLIPQPDTEILVEEAIKKINEIKNGKTIKVLDLCTGSGVIAISIKKYVNENVEVYATDISEKAIKIAKKNANLNGVINNIEFIESNLFEKLKNEKFDIIVSNPPYIKKEDIQYLSEEVKKEPLIALNGGTDGLSFYRKIANEAIEYLKLGSYLCFEIGYDQKEEVINIIENEQKYKGTYCKKDLYGNDRVIITHVG